MSILNFLTEYNMYFYIVFMLTGTLLGYCGRVPGVFKKYNGRIQTVCLGILLFAIGYEIGNDHRLLMTLGPIGIKAAFISIMSVIGTVIFINITARLLGSERVRSS